MFPITIVCKAFKIAIIITNLFTIWGKGDWYGDVYCLFIWLFFLSLIFISFWDFHRGNAWMPWMSLQVKSPVLLVYLQLSTKPPIFNRTILPTAHRPSGKFPSPPTLVRACFQKIFSFTSRARRLPAGVSDPPSHPSRVFSRIWTCELFSSWFVAGVVCLTSCLPHLSRSWHTSWQQCSVFYWTSFLGTFSILLLLFIFN